MKNLIFALLFLPILAFSQEGKHKVSLGVFILPEMNGLLTSNMDGNEKTELKLGISGGFNFEVRLTEKLAFRSGLGYGFKRYNHSQKLSFGTDIDPHQGFISSSRLESHMSYSEIQLPLLLQVKFKTGFFFTFGLELNGAFADHSKRTIYYGNGDITQLNNQKGMKINYAPIVSVGYTVPNIGLSIETLFKLYLKEYVVPEAFLYNFGLKITYNIVH